MLHSHHSPVIRRQSLSSDSVRAVADSVEACRSSQRRYDMIQPMRLAWFSPLPPVRSGIAAYSADAVTAARPRGDDRPLRRSPGALWMAPPLTHTTSSGSSSAIRTIWSSISSATHRATTTCGRTWRGIPASSCCTMRALHHARARQPARSRSAFGDYRAEFRYDHPTRFRTSPSTRSRGSSGSIYYFWSMARVVVRDAREGCRPQRAPRGRSARAVSRHRGRRRFAWASQRSGAPDEARRHTRHALALPRRRGGVCRVRESDGRKTHRSDSARARRPHRRRHRRASDARRRRRRATSHSAGHRAPGHCRSRPRHGLRGGRAMWDGIWRRPTSACACGGRRRRKHPHRGCAASPRRGRP